MGTLPSQITTLADSIGQNRFTAFWSVPRQPTDLQAAAWQTLSGAGPGIATPVPEPQSVWLLAAGLAMLVVIRVIRRRLHVRRAQVIRPAPRVSSEPK